MFFSYKEPHACHDRIIQTKLYTVAVYFSFIPGECQFKDSWQGEWFQSGVPTNLHVNGTYIETKGVCYEEEGDKYLVYDK